MALRGLFGSRQAPFDAVLMLTWSDWRTEPRSNRYHYASRFARHVPVYFVQPIGQPGQAMRCGPSELAGVELIETGKDLTEAEAGDLLQLLRDRGVTRPLVWIYNPVDFHHVLSRLTASFVVFHATEDYFTESPSMQVWRIEEIRAAVRAIVPTLDLLVSVSEGVQESFKRATALAAPAVVALNGCDARFFFGIVDGLEPAAPAGARPRAIYQGGINERLDFDLLADVARALPEWDFVFCGSAAQSQGWKRLQALPNVIHKGNLSPEEVALEMAGADVGLIPFRQDDWIRNSLPLKAYEYVACGLPVVSIPINALQAHPELFTFAHDAATMTEKLRHAVASRHDPELMLQRRSAAHANSYDARFNEVCEHIADGVERRRGRRLNIAVLVGSQTTAFLGLAELLHHQAHFDVSVLRPPALVASSWKGRNDALDMFDAVVIDAVDVEAWTGDDSMAFFWLQRFSGVRLMWFDPTSSRVRRAGQATKDVRRMKAFGAHWALCPAHAEESDMPAAWIVRREQILRLTDPLARQIAQTIAGLPILARPRRQSVASVLELDGKGMLRPVFPPGVLVALGGSDVLVPLPADLNVDDGLHQSDRLEGDGGWSRGVRRAATRARSSLRLGTRAVLWRLLRWVKASDTLTLLALNLWSRLPGSARSAILKLMQRR